MNTAAKLSAYGAALVLLVVAARGTRDRELLMEGPLATH